MGEQVERVASREKLNALLEAVLAVGSELELDTVLRRIVECAVELADARRGALGVFGEEGAVRRFIPVGMDPGSLAKTGSGPRGDGILFILPEAESSRPAHEDADPPAPDSAGHRAGGRPARGVLDAPIRVRGRLFGKLYLADRRGGPEFDDQDAAVLRTFASAAGVAIDHARLYEDAERRQRWLAQSAEMTRALLAGTDPAEVLHALAGAVQELAGADLVTLAVPLPGTDELVIEAAAGSRAGTVTGLRLPATTLAAKVLRSGEIIASDHLSTDPRSEGGSAAMVDLGPAFFVPVGVAGQIVGVLNVARAPGSTPFDTGDQEMISGFAGQAGLALQIADHRRTFEQLTVFEDRDRIARDLHDLVIQRLFAAGLSAQGALARITDRRVAERISQVVDDLDDTIKTIRTSIYGLHVHEGDGEQRGLRAGLLAEVDRAAERLGFTPVLRMTGPLDMAVPDEFGEHLLAALRETLSNVARHARATAVDVDVDVDLDAAALTLRVADNGRGVDPAVTRRSGLANLRARAEELGGTFTLAPNQPSGTIARWTGQLPEE